LLVLHGLWPRPLRDAPRSRVVFAHRHAGLLDFGRFANGQREHVKMGRYLVHELVDRDLLARYDVDRFEVQQLQADRQGSEEAGVSGRLLELWRTTGMIEDT